MRDERDVRDEYSRSSAYVKISCGVWLQVGHM